VNKLKYYKAINKHGVVKLEHRLILEEKLGRKLTADEIVHHIDGNKWNNNSDNLVIMTRSEHAKLHGFGCDKGKPVGQTDEDGNILRIWPSARAASREVNGAAYQNIYKCCIGKRNTAGGYGWVYI